jgi:hypothetical protein
MGSSLIGRIVLDVFRVLGVVLFLAGLVWALQGLNLLPGTFMKGDLKWTVIGSATAAAGLVLLVIANWRRKG